GSDLPASMTGPGRNEGRFTFVPFYGDSHRRRIGCQRQFTRTTIDFPDLISAGCPIPFEIGSKRFSWLRADRPFQPTSFWQMWFTRTTLSPGHASVFRIYDKSTRFQQMQLPLYTDSSMWMYLSRLRRAIPCLERAVRSKNNSEWSRAQGRQRI